MSTHKLVRSLSTRAVKKVEKPKPMKNTLLKCPDSPQSTTTLEEIMALINSVSQSVVQKNASQDKELLSLTTSLMAKMKMYGSRLEECFEAQLDRAFINFRNGAKGDSIQDHAVKLNLLHLIELRAMQWQTNVAMNNYYTKGSSVHDASDIMDPSVSSTYFPQNLMLAPGEVIKSSGKFTSPTKLPGKNYCKDEIVIRNADSGKVNPGAKERLVQITGPEEDKIMFAKQLIEETIKRNASPIREVEKEVGSNSSLNSSISEDVSNIGPEDYTFSICQGDKRVMILKGQDLELLKNAKVLLEQYLPKKSGGPQNIHKAQLFLNDDLDPDFVNSASSTLIDESVNAINNAVLQEALYVNSTKEVFPNNIHENETKNVQTSSVNRSHSFKGMEFKEYDSPPRRNAKEKTEELLKTNNYEKGPLKSNTGWRIDPFKSTGNNIHKNPCTEPVRGNKIDSYVENSSQKSKDSPEKEVSLGYEGNDKEVSPKEKEVPLKPKAPCIEYTKHFLMDCSSSKASLKYPADWEKICAQFPNITKENPVYFDAAAYTKRRNDYIEQCHELASNCTLLETEN
ncbi:uncharacterized protein LOC106665626 isoform X3 [Cimex lectularius]|uniref:Eukaryotic translation initiation factor 4E-binding protein Mextli n=1 Tax=Cimex lectularius TaxID=79782 RepID=A0A8I6TDR4_CIMLE|nr:uncharacterized protein LOC106665626 isoform X3 [Cimex lectularius]